VSDVRRRELERRVAAGDESAHAPLLADMLRTGDLDRSQVEILSCLDDPVARQVEPRCPVNHLLFRGQGLRKAEEWLVELQLGTAQSANAFGDLVLAVSFATFEARVAAPAFLGEEDTRVARGLWRIGRNLIRATGSAGAMARLLRRRLDDHPATLGDPVVRHTAHFLDVHAQMYIPASQLALVAGRVLNACWHVVSRETPRREVTPWLRRNTRRVLRKWWGLPSDPTARTNPVSDQGCYLFVHSCPGAQCGEDIQALRESEVQITRQTFARKIGLEQWKWLQAELGYDRDFPISQADWQIPYYKGTYRGVPAVFLEWSGFEYIFTLDGELGPSLASTRWE
jgi:hypothetical protein